MRKVVSLLCALVFWMVSLPALAEEVGIRVTEEEGGEFRPLTMDLEGGSDLPFTFKYNTKNQFYEDPTIRVERHQEAEREKFRCTYWYAIITIRDPSQLRTTSADERKPFLGNATNTSIVMARRKKAVVAINGDYCASFSGEKASNYILRQGTVYRDTVTPGLDILLVDEDGDFHVLVPGETDLETVDKTQIDGKKVVNAFQFGPALVIDGEPVADEVLLDSSRSPTHAKPEGRAQRMCICQIDSLRYMVLCCAYHGVDLVTLRDLVLSVAPVKTAYTLDGGDSTQMVFLGRQFNSNNKNNETVRPITDIIYFASAWFTK